MIVSLFLQAYFEPHGHPLFNHTQVMFDALICIGACLLNTQFVAGNDVALSVVLMSCAVVGTGVLIGSLIMEKSRKIIVWYYYVYQIKILNNNITSIFLIINTVGESELIG